MVDFADLNNSTYHISVLYHETLNALAIKPDGLYVDGTAGGGGHSFGIASRLTAGGRLIAFDQDVSAIAEAGKRFEALPSEIRKNVELINQNFAFMNEALDKLGIGEVDGVLLDIGVSSHQFDNPERGFSYHHDAPLDMRMGNQEISAADMVNNHSEVELADIFFKFGEEKYSRSIARSIVNFRKESEIKTTLELAEIIKGSVPMAYRRSGHPARKVFQALRIAVNDELGVLEKTIEIAFERLKVGGRLSVITFHSLEDRIVKKYFTSLTVGCVCPPQIPICVCGKSPRGKLVNKKPIIASEAELEANSRSRSAKLRTIEKL